jgi:thioredoxin-like negative regulator of GroEL
VAVASHVGRFLETNRGPQVCYRLLYDGEAVTGFIGAHPASAIGSFLDEVIEKHGAPMEVA